MTIDINTIKENLLKEKGNLESELSSIGQKNSSNTSDWDGATPELPSDLADEGDVATNMEDFENNNAEVDQLEKQLQSVGAALEKIENGKYGLCEVCGNAIEDDRLEANPSAPTCKLHMN